MMKLKSALIVYFSSTGNTQKVAHAIKEGLEGGGLQVDLKKAQEVAKTDFFDCDLVCVGSPSIEWQPAKPISQFLKSNWLLIAAREKLNPAPRKLRGKTLWFFALILVLTQALTRQLLRGKR